MKTTKYKFFYVTVSVDDDGEWDGDEPLDADKDWTCYVLTLHGRTSDCDTCNHSQDETLDSLGGVWVSDNIDGRREIESSVADYLLANCDEPNLPGIEDIEIDYV